jgi:hypothetical protein
MSYNGSKYVYVNEYDGCVNINRVKYKEGINDHESYNGQPHSAKKWMVKEGTPIWDFTNMVPYDTGGYTGEWGPEGRIAMLHQKEIVLNARDTENMLAMTQMVRDIAK